ncbi:MAG: hypothetical protein ACR2JF_12505 [Iamia sp.]
MIEFVHIATGTVVGTLTQDLIPSNAAVSSVVDAKRHMGWTDEQILQRLPGWSNGYYLARSA